MPFTDRPTTEVPSRARIQTIKPTQINNAGLTRPTTPNNPTASSPSSQAPYPDALSSTRRQMAKDAVDTMTDEQLSEVLALARNSNPTLGRSLSDPRRELARGPVPNIGNGPDDGSRRFYPGYGDDDNGENYLHSPQYAPTVAGQLAPDITPESLPGDFRRGHTPSGGRFGTGVLGNPFKPESSNRLTIPWLNNN